LKYSDQMRSNKLVKKEIKIILFTSIWKTLRRFSSQQIKS